MLPLCGALVFLSSSAAQSGAAVLYGDTFLLSGDVEGGRAGQLVVVLARPHGQTDFGEVGRVRSSRGGNWRFHARPRIRTIYRARVGRLLSGRVVVDVEPRIVLRGGRGRFSAQVRGARSFAGKFLVLQRRVSGPWKDARQLVLDDSSSTRFTVKPPAQRTQIRLFMPRSQVGPGYVAARSDVITLSRP